MGTSARRAWLVARRRWRPLCALAACALAALAGLARLLAPPAHAAAASFPRVRPADLAHLLADISAHSLRGSWSLEEEAGNYTSWRYAVSYECGARCTGRARVEAHDLDAGPGLGPGQGPRHGAADGHRVLVRRSHCSTLPLLPWPVICEDVESESLVSRWGSEGAMLQERWVSRCGGAALLTCAGAARLEALALQRLQRLQDLLAPAHAAAADL